MSEPRPEAASSRRDPLGFAVQVDGDRVALVLRDRELYGFLELERLELEITGLAFPIDLAGGAARFQRRRGRVAAARLTVDDEGLAALARARAAALGAAGFEELEAHAEPGAIELWGRVRSGERAAELSARVTAIADGPFLRLGCERLRLYGPLRRPAPLVAHQLMAALLGAPLEREAETDVRAGGGATARAPGVFELAPLETLLFHLLPPSGWRLPDTTGLVLAGCEIARGRVTVTLEPQRGQPGTPPPPVSTPEGDRLLRGDLEGALVALRARLGNKAGPGPGPGDDEAAERLLTLLLAQGSTQREAEELARTLEAQGRAQLAAQLALGAVALDRGQHAAAAAHYADAFEAAQVDGDEAAQVGAALMAARLLAEEDPPRATAWFERVLERRPRHREASEALTERLADEQRWPELARHLRRRLAAAGDRREQAREHVRLGELLLDRLGDPERARDELESAVRLDDQSRRAHESLARALEALGDRAGAVRALDRLAMLQAQLGDVPGEARTQARVAALWLREGDLAGAHNRLRRATELSPDEAELFERLAGVAEARDRAEEAAAAWRRLVELAADDPKRRQRAHLELARLSLAAGDAAAAHEALAQAREETPEKLGLLAALAEKEARPQEAARALDRAAELEGDAQKRAALLLRRGRLLLPLEGEEAEALEALAEAHRAAPDRPAGQEAARALALAARRRGDAAAEAEWLERVLDGESEAPDRGDLLLRRAELALAAGDAATARDRARAADAAGAPAARAQVVLAEALGRLGDDAGRAALLERAADVERDDETRAVLLARAADARLRAGEVDGALVLARRAAALASGHVEVRTALAETAWRARAWEDVVFATAPLAEGQRGAARAESLRRLGHALGERGQDAEALAPLSAAVATAEAAGETAAAAWRKLAELHERLGDPAAAAGALIACAADTRTADTAAARAGLACRAAELHRKRRGDPGAAVAAYEAALRHDPELMPALDALEAIHQEAGELARVAAILGRKIAATSRHPERQKALLCRLAELHAGPLDRPDAAREAWRRALELDPEFRPALRRLAPDALERGERAEARAHFERLAAASPAGAAVDDEEAERAERIAALMALATMDAADDQPGAAADRLRAALELDPDRHDVADALEQQLASAGRLAELAELLGQRVARATDPHTGARLEARRARLLAERLGEEERALDAVKLALSRYPDDPELLAIWAACARTLDRPTELGRALARAGDIAGAGDAFRRALAKDPADQAAAEAWRDAAIRARDGAGERAALDALLEAQRRAGGGVARELTVLADMARAARAAGDFVGARDALDQAARLDPRDPVLARERAELCAILGDFPACADRLDELSRLLGDETDAERELCAEILIELADVRERRLSQWDAARAALERAALVAPAGARKLALARQWAAYAAEAGQHAEAIVACGLIPEPSRTIADWVGLARALVTTGKGMAAIAAYEAAQTVGPLSDEEALELFTLYRHNDEQRRLAAALERTAQLAAPGTAIVRLREALALYQGDLGDEEAAARVRGLLAGLGVESPAPSAGPPAEEAPAELAQALADHARSLAARGQALDDAGRQMVETLRERARAASAYAALADGLFVAAAAEADGSLAAAWLCEVAAVRRAHLGDAAGAADAMMRALIFDPDDERIAHDVDSLLRELGDFSRLVDLHELRLRRAKGPARAPILVELGRLWADAFGEPDRAAACLAEAVAVDPTLSSALLPLADHHARLGELAPAEDYYRRALAAGAVGPGEGAEAVARTRLAEVLLRQGRAAEAVAALEPVADHPAAAAEMDQALRLADEWDRLLERLRARGAAAGDPQSRAAALREAAALLDGPLGRPEEAAPLYHELLHVDADDELARARLSAITEATRVAPEEIELEAGRAEEARGNLEAAIAHYENAWAALPGEASLAALWRVASARDDDEHLAELYGRRLLLAGDDRELRARLWVERARLYRDRLRREPEAYRCLKEAVACDPRSADACGELRTLAFARGEWPLAAELLYREIEATAEPIERAALHVELAMIYEERLHDLESAIRNYETARGLDPDGPVPPPALARLYAMTRRTAEAARAEEAVAALATDPAARAEHLTRAGALWEQADERAEALRVYRAAAAIDGGGDAARAAATKLGRLAEPSAGETRQKLLDRLALAVDAEERLEITRRLLAAAVAEDDDEEVLARSADVLARAPLDVTAFNERRRVLHKRGELGALVEHLRARAEAEPEARERAQRWFELGRLHADRLRDQPRAAAAFEEALRADPAHAAALDALADIAYRQHDWERARTLYRRLDPEASALGADVIWFRRAELAEAIGVEAEAEAAYRQAAARNPSNLGALEALARLALIRGELTAGIAALEQVLELLPLDDVERLTSLRLQLGELCHKTGNGAAARRYFELVLAEDPQSTAALTPLTELYANAAEWPRAADMLGRLAALAGTRERRADLLFRQGEVLRIHLGDEEQAADCYLKAVDLDENHLPTLRRLVDYYFREEDHGSLVEIADELARRGALVTPDTPNETLARVAVSAALHGRDAQARALAAHLGAAGAGALAAALAEHRRRNAEADDKLARAAQLLCEPPGPSLEAVRAVLAVRGSKDPASAALAKRL